MDTNSLPNSHTNKDHKWTLSQASLFRWNLPESSRLHNNIFITLQNTVRKSSLYNKIPSVPNTAHSLPWQHWTFHFTLFTTYMIFHQSNNVCHYNCSFSLFYIFTCMVFTKHDIVPPFSHIHGWSFSHHTPFGPYPNSQIPNSKHISCYFYLFSHINPAHYSPLV